MGSKFSEHEKNDEPSYFVANNISFEIMDDLLIEILSHLSGSFLIHNCRLVCKNWMTLIDEQSIWKLKCEKERKSIPSVPVKEIPPYFYRDIYFFDPYGKNLIDNPCGEVSDFKFWNIEERSEDNFITENPPVGADPVPDEVGSQCCYATTYTICAKYQIVNFAEKHVHDEVLSLKKTKIEVGEWYAARFDCSSLYSLRVILLDKSCPDMSSILEDYILDEFTFSYTEPQWTGREWHKVSHTFENVSPRVGYVLFYHHGNDLQFWAGHYGSKFTGAYVRVIAP